jgi:hypothetical protein
VKRIVLADPPKDVALGRTGWSLPEDEPGPAQGSGKAQSENKGQKEGERGKKVARKHNKDKAGKGKEGKGKQDDMDWFKAGVCAVSMDDLLPSLEQIILTRSFTIALVKFIAAQGGLQRPTRLEIDPMGDAVVPKWATFARELILESGPSHSVFWDLDFPFTLQSWLAHDTTATEAQYYAIAQTGAVRDVLRCLLGAADIRDDEEYSLGELSHILALTL